MVCVNMFSLTWVSQQPLPCACGRILLSSSAWSPRGSSPGYHSEPFSGWRMTPSLDPLWQAQLQELGSDRNINQKSITTLVNVRPPRHLLNILRLGVDQRRGADLNYVSYPLVLSNYIVIGSRPSNSNTYPPFWYSYSSFLLAPWVCPHPLSQP